jgi:exopolyphosphatase / guanosine-5'-triphosphate,3'-diphosphate pyrophosphatase
VSGRRIAVVDLGTNSTRLLVADVDGDRLSEVVRKTQVTRLGEGVDATGALSDGAVARVFDALEGFRRAMDDSAADEVVGIATSAVRDARNGAIFSAELIERFGIDARTISGDEEARLTFRGATAGDDPGDAHTLVVDIGGGSTELVTGRPGGAPDFHVSTQLGSVRQSERHLVDDPPSREQLSALADEVRRTIEAEVPRPIRRSPAVGIAVAGTATSLAAIDQRLDPYDPDRVHGYRLSLAACERMLAMLAALPLVERRGVPGLHPDRAPTIVAGAAILVEAMRAFALDGLDASEWDVLHGAALEAGAGGGTAPGGHRVRSGGRQQGEAG